VRITAFSVILLLALAATAGQAQYVEDSLLAFRWVGDMVYNQRYGRVLAASQVDSSVFAILCFRNEVLNANYVPLPLHLTLNSSQNKLYCTRGDGWDDYVRVMNGIDCRYITEFPLTGAFDLIWDSVDNRVYVSCQEDERIAVIDCNTDSLIGYIHVSGDPSYLELNTRHHKLYVRNWNETVSIIDLNTQQVTRTIAVGNVPDCGYYGPAVDKYYCGADDLLVFSGSGDTVDAVMGFPVYFGARSIAGAEADSLVFVGTYSGIYVDTLYVLTGSGDSVVAALPAVGGNPRVLVWVPQTNRVYCAGQRGTMDVFRGDGTGSIASFPFVHNALCAAYSPEYGRLYVGSSDGQRVYVVRDTVVGIEEPIAKPVNEARLRAKPNPFCGSVRIEAGGQPGVTTVAVYAQDGRLVRTLRIAGDACDWDGNDVDGRPVAAGVYVVTAGTDRQDRIRVVKTR
jgi:YVTN family beta-propeller protein